MLFGRKAETMQDELRHLKKKREKPIIFQAATMLKSNLAVQSLFAKHVQPSPVLDQEEQNHDPSDKKATDRPGSEQGIWTNLAEGIKELTAESKDEKEQALLLRGRLELIFWVTLVLMFIVELVSCVFMMGDRDISRIGRIVALTTLITGVSILILVNLKAKKWNQQHPKNKIALPINSMSTTFEDSPRR